MAETRHLQNCHRQIIWKASSSERGPPIFLAESHVMSRRFSLLPLCFAVLSAGCFEMFDNTPTNPNPTIQLLGNQWESASPNADKLLSSCSNFHYTVTEPQSGSTIGGGTFTAT